MRTEKLVRISVAVLSITLLMIVLLGADHESGAREPSITNETENAPGDGQWTSEYDTGGYDGSEVDNTSLVVNWFSAWA